MSQIPIVEYLMPRESTLSELTIDVHTNKETSEICGMCKTTFSTDYISELTRITTQ